MTKQKTAESKKGRKRYSVEFKHQALLRAVKAGVPAAAQELGLSRRSSMPGARKRISWGRTMRRSG